MLSKEERNSLKEIIGNCLRKKFKSYNPEPAHMPFHTSLIGKDRLALYQFIHSLNTAFGTSIFEPVAEKLAQKKFKVVSRQVAVGNCISTESNRVISDIINQLSSNGNPNKCKEINTIREVFNKGKLNKIKPIKADIYLEDYKKNIFLIDIKTAKPNKSGFSVFKRTLLEWIAIALLNEKNKEKRIHSLIAIPYNPYYPKAYSRWTMAGMFDLKKELKVANEFWDFLGGDNTYDALIECFTEVGIEMRDEIDIHFKNYK